MHTDVEQILITSEQIQARLVELAAQMDRDYADRGVLLVGVLKGAFILMADLARYLTIDAEFDFMAVSSYGSSTRSSGVVRILKDLEREISGRHVVVVEDIVDSGLTLRYLIGNLVARDPASLEIFTLLSKPDQMMVDVPLRYHGFAVPNVFVVGYGLDYAERYRNLPYVGTLKPAVYAQA
ncbi:MAG: hypoxanthine phosphoribosyltransferase [Egibacteraceae bacterium]